MSAPISELPGFKIFGKTLYVEDTPEGAAKTAEAFMLWIAGLERDRKALGAEKIRSMRELATASANDGVSRDSFTVEPMPPRTFSRDG